MNSKKLGRGLDALIRRTEASHSGEEITVRNLDPRQIQVNRSQPRQHFDETALDELATSIANDGILQPLVVRPNGDDGYELVAGERRLRAAVKIGMATVPAVVRTIQEERLLMLALIENIQREDLNPIETALAYREIQQRNLWSQQQLADHLGKKRPSIANALRFLDLEPEIQESIALGRLSPGHGKLLLSVSAVPKRKELHQQALAEGWTVRQLDDAVRGPVVAAGPSVGGSGRRSRGKPSEADPQLVAEGDLLSRSLGTQVRVRERGDGGQIVIDFYDPGDYQRLRRHLIGES